MKVFLAIISIIFVNQNLFSQESSPKLRGEFFYQKRNLDQIDQKTYDQAKSDKLNYLKKAKNSKLLSNQPKWEQLGPGNIGGRVRSIAIHPFDPNKVWIASASGGIWYSSDGGNSWEPQFDDKETLSFGAIAIDPNRPNILFAASGEGALNLDAYSGRGIFKSLDSGKSWHNIGLRNVSSFNKIIVHPLNSDLIYVGGFGSDPGLYRSKDGGISWENIFKKHITDISTLPNNSQKLLVSTENSGVYLSNDGANNFEQVIGEQELQIGKPARSSAQFAFNPNIAYALVELEESGNATILKSLDGGESWDIAQKNNNQIFGLNNHGFYNNFLEIDPNNENNVLLGGVQLFRSTDGLNFGSISRLDGEDIHVDQHCVEFSLSNPKIAYLGNDGGVYKTTNSGKDWFPVNNGLYITQFYGMDIDQSFENANYGGTQDNNNITNRFSSKNWFKIGPGDGFEPQVVKSNPNIVYIQTQFGNIFKLDISKGISDNISNSLPPRSSGNSLFDSPLRLDYNRENTLYHGGRRLWRINYSSSEEPEWESVAGVSSGRISSIEPSKSNSNLIYFGTEDGQIWLSENYGNDWKNIDFVGGKNRFVTDIQSSHFNNTEVFVSYANYDGTRLIFSDDKGESWRDISGKLPKVPINDIELDSKNPNNIFVATDIGVYASFNKGETWLAYGTDLPMVPVNDIDIYEDQEFLTGKRFLRAATHGRSIWQIEIKSDINEPEIISPSGGEKLVAGSEFEIIWFGPENIKFELSTDNGQSFQEIQLFKKDGKDIWKIPYLYSDNAFLKMTFDGKEYISKPFSIVPNKEGSLLSSKTIGGTPYGICFYEDKIYSCDFYENKIKVFDRSLNLIDTINLKNNRRFYTDLDIYQDQIYLTRMNSESGGGGFIEIFDFQGNLLKTQVHPAQGSDAYPIGLEIIGNELIVSDREQERSIYYLDLNSLKVLRTIKNPCDIFAGPRGLSSSGSDLIQLCTHFENGLLIETEISSINEGDESRSIYLEEFGMNARGLAFDSLDGNFWVSGFEGEIRKYRGFNGLSGIQDSEEIIDLKIFPIPADNYINIDANGLSHRIQRIYIVDIFGRKSGIDIDKFILSSKEIKIDLKNVPIGIYYLSLELQNGRRFTKKFVISR